MVGERSPKPSMWVRFLPSVLLHVIASKSDFGNRRSRILVAKKETERNLLNMKLVENIKESYNELVHKTSWPTRKELSQSAVVVLVASIILSLVVWAMDWCFESIMSFVYGLF